jgi:hypothetical protein
MKMMKKIDAKSNLCITILGGSIIGLYAAVRCIDIGYNVTIIDKKCNFGTTCINNFKYFNKNHYTYINLLNKFNIKYSQIVTNMNSRLQTIINHIISRTQFIPKKTLTSQSFVNFCQNILSSYEYEILNNNIDNFEHIFSKLNTQDGINIFIHDINANIENYCLDDDFDTLIKRILEYLIDHDVKFIHSNIKDFRYINRQFLLYDCLYPDDINNYIFNSDILICALSKKNLIHLKFWNKEQRLLLNSVFNYNISVDDINKILYNKNICNDDIQKYTLESIHLVFPQVMCKLCKSKNNIYVWNIGINNIFIREKIKNLYNPYFILCSESYAKNCFFINYALETFDANVQRLIKLSCNSSL